VKIIPAEWYPSYYIPKSTGEWIEVYSILLIYALLYLVSPL
jgi:hypothetical protein